MIRHINHNWIRRSNLKFPKLKECSLVSCFFINKSAQYVLTSFRYTTNYIIDVLLKEGLIFLSMQSKDKESDYDQVNELLQSSEIDFRKR